MISTFVPRLRSVGILSIFVALFYSFSAAADEKAAPIDPMPLPLVPRWNKEKPWIVEGQILDGQKQARPHANISLIANLHSADSPTVPPLLLAEAQAGADRNFRISTPSLEWYQCRLLTIVVNDAGYSTLTQSLNVRGKHHSFGDLTLNSSRTVKGKLLTKQGAPATGVKLDVASFSTGESALAKYKPGRPKPSAWPEPVTTDAKGEFSLSFLPPQAAAMVVLSTADAKYSPAPMFASIEAGKSEFTLTCEPAMEVRGQVICQDSGKPLANAWLIVVSLSNTFSSGADQQSRGYETRADADGHFVVNCPPGKFVTVYVYPAAGPPYSA